jgi:hypothetical protein
MWYAPDNFLMLFSYGQIPTMGTVKDLNGSLLWAQPSLLRIMLDYLDLLVMKKRSYKMQLPWWTLYRYSSIFSLSGEYSGGFTLI